MTDHPRSAIEAAFPPGTLPIPTYPVAVKLPGDLCACGHARNKHSGYGLGRCLASTVATAGCSCTSLRAPAPEQLGPLMTYGGTTIPYDPRRGR